MKRILFAMSLMAATTASFAQVAKPMEDAQGYQGWRLGDHLHRS